MKKTVAIIIVLLTAMTMTAFAGDFDADKFEDTIIKEINEFCKETSSNSNACVIDQIASIEVYMDKYSSHIDSAGKYFETNEVELKDSFESISRIPPEHIIIAGCLMDNMLDIRKYPTMRYNYTELLKCTDQAFESLRREKLTRRFK